MGYKLILWWHSLYRLFVTDCWSWYESYKFTMQCQISKPVCSFIIMAITQLFVSVSPLGDHILDIASPQEHIHWWFRQCLMHNWSGLGSMAYQMLASDSRDIPCCPNGNVHPRVLLLPHQGYPLKHLVSRAATYRTWWEGTYLCLLDGLLLRVNSSCDTGVHEWGIPNNVGLTCSTRGGLIMCILN